MVWEQQRERNFQAAYEEPMGPTFCPVLAVTPWTAMGYETTLILSCRLLNSDGTFVQNCTAQYHICRELGFCRRDESVSCVVSMRGRGSNPTPSANQSWILSLFLSFLGRPRFFGPIDWNSPTRGPSL